MRSLRILIIDDDEDVADSLAEFLELDDHRVDVAFTGESGIARALEGDYEQVIVDMSLPDCSGLDCMHRICREKPDARVLLMTGHSVAHLSETFPEARSVEVLTKPLDLERLRRRLDAL